MAHYNLPLPYKFKPRKYQYPLFIAIDRGVQGKPGGTKRAVCIWHRRAGKDKSLLNLVIHQAYQRVGIYYYFFPTYSQGRKILWDGVDKDGMKFLDHIPDYIVVSKNSSEMKIKLKNGSLIQVIGTDNIDTIVGTNPVGCVFSEYSLQDPQAWDFVRPILAENDGWAVFNYTPRGRNHGWELYQMAKSNPAWFCQLLTVDDTNAVSQAAIQAERDSGMSEDMIQQEFYCNFNVVSGRAFDFNEHDHVIEPLPVPKYATIYMTMDWGYGAPFSIGWWWVDADARIYRFAEWYGWNGKPNIGLRMSDDEIAQGIIAKEEDLKLHGHNIIRLSGPDCFSKKPNYMGGGQGPATSEVFSRYGIHLTPGDATREKKIRQFRNRLVVPKDNTLPMMVVYNTCSQFIRTIPMIMTAKNNVEYIDETGEVHVFDESCHICMAHPIAMREPPRLKSMIEKHLEDLDKKETGFEHIFTVHKAQHDKDMLFNDNVYGGLVGQVELIETIKE